MPFFRGWWGFQRPVGQMGKKKEKRINGKGIKKVE
jgi:hypothetical protein